MSSELRLGAKLRRFREQQALSQKAMAKALGISASYLALIEGNRRPLTVPVLLKLARTYEIDLDDFSAEDDVRLEEDLKEALAVPLPAFRNRDWSDADLSRFAESTPGLARGVVELARAYEAGRASAQTLAERLTQPGMSDASGEFLDGEFAAVTQAPILPTEEVSDFFQDGWNYFPALEDAAERLWSDARLDRDNLYHGLVGYLRHRHAVSVEVRSVEQMGRVVRRFDPKRKTVHLSRLLRPRTLLFALAKQIGLLELKETLDELVSSPRLTSPDSRELARLALGSYFAGAVLMPYDPFLAEAESKRYDLEMLGHRFRTSFEQVCHRMTTLRRPGSEGIPFHFIRVDIAGNITKHFSASGIRFPRFGAGCPLWNVYRAFQSPGRIRIQISRMPGGDAYFCMAATINKGFGGYKDEHTVQAIGMGCRMADASKLVYADGIDLKNTIPVKIGVTCRLCERKGCRERAFPALSVPLKVDRNERGLSPYEGTE